MMKYMQNLRSLFDRLTGKVSADNDVLLTLKVSNIRVCGKSLDELETLFKRHFRVISILQGNDMVMRMPTSDTKINAGDQLLVQVNPNDVSAIQALVGERL